MQAIKVVVALFKWIFSLLRGEERALVARMPLATVGQSVGFRLAIVSLKVGAFCLMPVLFAVASMATFILLCGVMSLFIVFVLPFLLSKAMVVVSSITIGQWFLLASLTVNALFIWAWKSGR